MRKKLISVTNQTIRNQLVKDFSQTVTYEQMNDLTQNAYAHNSVLAMTKDWNLFVEFCQVKGVKSLPALTTAVRQFIEREATQRKFATIKRYGTTISIIHQILGLKDPTSNTQVRTALMTQRINKQGDAGQAQSMNKSHLDELYKTMINAGSVKDARDLAIYFLMFECALKRGELRDMTFSQIVLTEDYTMVMVGDNSYQLSGQAHEALNRWIPLVPDQCDALFRSIDRHENIAAGPLNDSSIFRILRNAGERIGRTDLKFSGQSTRIGAARELYKQGYKTREVQTFGRWLSPAMPAQYVGNARTAEKEKLKFLSFKPWE